MSQEEIIERIKEILVCRWFDVGNWRFSCDPSSEDYYPNQWWDFSALTVFVFPEAKDLGRGVLIDVDEEIVNALKEHNLKCSSSAKDEIEALGLKCQVVNEFDNIDEHIVFGVKNRKLYVPYSYLNHP